MPYSDNYMSVKKVENCQDGCILLRQVQTVKTVADCIRKFSDGVNKVAGGVRKVSDGVRKVSDGVRKV